MVYRLRDGLHWCQCSGRIVLLDLLADRYSSLPQSATDPFIRLLTGDMQALAEQELEPLLAAGLLIDDPADRRYPWPKSIPAVAGDYVEVECASAISADVLRVLAAQLRWMFLLKRIPLAAIVRRLEAPSRAALPSHETDGRLQRLVRAFAAVSLVIPAADRCLVRALTFRAICGQLGIRPLLVFGVRLNPFRAHCWLQLDGRVLIGEFEQVRLFTPIAAIA